MTKTKPLPGWEINPALQTDDHAITISDRQSGRIIALVCTEHPVEATAEEERTAKRICALSELIEACRRVAKTDPDSMTDQSQFIAWAQSICGDACKKAGAL